MKNFALSLLYLSGWRKMLVLVGIFCFAVIFCLFKGSPL